MIEKKELAEWTRIHGNYYGTSHAQLQSVEGDTGVDLIFEIEGDGATQIMGQYPMAVTIFILPPSMEELKKRLVLRKEDAPDEIDRRMAHSKKEMKYIEHFDYVIVNDDFQEAADQLEAIVTAARIRRQLVWPKISRRFKG